MAWGVAVGSGAGAAVGSTGSVGGVGEGAGGVAVGGTGEGVAVEVRADSGAAGGSVGAASGTAGASHPASARNNRNREKRRTNTLRIIGDPQDGGAQNGCGRPSSRTRSASVVVWVSAVQARH